MKNFLKGLRNDRASMETMRTPAYRGGLVVGFLVPWIATLVVGFALGAWIVD